MIKSLAKLVLSWGLLIARDARAIFVFHDISNPGEVGHSPLYSTPVERFREQIDFLAEAFRLVSLDDLLASPEPTRLASITFDDGFRSVLEHAHPLLSARSIPYAVFANRQAVEANALVYSAEYPELNAAKAGKIYLNGAELGELSRAGVEIGSHTVSHPVLADLPETQAREEIVGNKRYLENLLGRAVKHFAFPYGKERHYRAGDAQEARAAGHSALYSTEPRFFRRQQIDPAARVIPRITLTDQRPPQIRALLNRGLFPLPRAPGAKRVFYVYSKLTYRDPAIERLAKSLQAKGFDLHFLLLNEAPGSPLELGLRETGASVHHLPFRSKRDLAAATVRTAALLRKHGADVVHTHLIDANLVGLTAGLLARTRKRIYTRHHSDQNCVYFPHAVYYDKYANLLATRVVATSENVRAVLVQMEAVAPGKVALISYAIAPEAFIDVPTERVERIRNKYGLSGRRPVVGIVSRYIEWKGVQYALPAFRRVAEQHPEAFFVFAGAYPTAYRHKELAPSFGQLPKDSFVEIECEEDMPALYKCLDAFVHVPHDRTCEAFGLVYVEALMAGVPSVFTLSGIAPEFIRHEEQALVVDFKNSQQIAAAIERILSEPGLKDRLVAEGRRAAIERFGMNQTVEALQELYR